MGSLIGNKGELNMTDDKLLSTMWHHIALARKAFEQIDDEYVQQEYLDIGETLEDMDIDLTFRLNVEF